MEISELIKENRKLKKLSQEDLAKQLHISRQSISKWETGKTLPTTDQLILLSEIFDLSLDTLLKGDPNMKEKVKKESSQFLWWKDPITRRIMFGFWLVIIPLLFILKYVLHLF